MEYYVGVERRRLVVEWSGSEVMNQHYIRRFSSRLLKISVLLYLPVIPINHRITMCRRMRRVWDRLFPSVARMNRLMVSVVMDLSIPAGITVADDLLLSFLERTGLDDVCRDVDLLGIYYQPSQLASRVNRMSLVFGFSPDDLDHYLTNRRVSHEFICYGPNGDDTI